MKTLTKFLITIVIFTTVLAIGFRIWFAIGMISTNSPKPIKLEWVNQYKTVIKKDFSCINDVKIYYKQGRVRFDFNTGSEIVLEDCKEIVKATKNFIEKETTSDSLIGNDFDQLSIRLEFYVSKESYVFESPYWIPSQDQNNNPNLDVKNNYKTWYFNINNVLQEKLEF